MQIKVTTLLKNLAGDAPLLDEDSKTIPLRAPLLNVLINTLKVPGPNGQMDEQVDGETKVRMFLLAQRIGRHTTVDLTAEDVTLLKDRIAKAYPALLTARVWELIDPASVNGADKAESKPRSRAPRRAKKVTKKSRKR